MVFVGMLHEAGEQSREFDMRQIADSLDKVRCGLVVYTDTPQACINFDEYTGPGIVPLCGIVQPSFIECRHCQFEVGIICCRALSSGPSRPRHVVKFRRLKSYSAAAASRISCGVELITSA